LAGHVAAANALADHLSRDAMSYFWDRALAGELPYSTGPSPMEVFHRLLDEEIGRNLDLWEMATGQTCQSLSKAQRLALGAYVADRQREERKRRQRASYGQPRASWTGFRAGEPWFARLNQQLENEAAYLQREAPGDLLDYHETLALLWAFGRDLRRYGKRRKLKPRKGDKAETFEIWPGPASPVRIVPMPDFCGVQLPVAGEWYRRFAWTAQRWRTRPATVNRLWTPRPTFQFERGYKQPSPFWAAPTPEEDATRLTVSEKTRVGLRAKALREKSARIRHHAELMRSMYELSETLEAGLQPARMAA